jgi:acyl-CoA reductase-like NAD-dependent aldehyde dehydrogenase
LTPAERADLMTPFGGFNCSGIGRELGPEGLEAYLGPKQIKLPRGYEVR